LGRSAGPPGLGAAPSKGLPSVGYRERGTKIFYPKPKKNNRERRWWLKGDSGTRKAPKKPSMALGNETVGKGSLEAEKPAQRPGFFR